MGLELYFRWNGEPWRRCHSFTIAFLAAVTASLQEADTTATYDDTGGTGRILEGANNAVKWRGANGAAGDSTEGIVVGTGTNAVTNTDSSLQTKIAHGAGAGQLQYGSMGFTEAAVVGANVDLILSRTFTNNSGGSITVEEVGIEAIMRDSGGTDRDFLLARDLATQAIADTASATAQYTLRTTA